ncbi:hypothetical protein RUM43_009210 [Polyplax serrata]|uniref:Lysosome-associated membrane glycoprotein 2-like luminal domain-containing protein n=1 Tax=Polyplax serrata TaxID=468196 RepID=A0AAN8S1Y3_POLSC
MHSTILTNILLFYIIGLLRKSHAVSINRTGLNEFNAKLPPGLTIENLQLGSMNDRKTKTTRAPPVLAVSSARPPPAPESESSAIVYRLNANNGAACILISTDGLIDFDYDTTLGEKREKPIYLPEVFETRGNCERPDDAYINVIWEGYKWSVYFSKTPGGEHWYVSKMELTLDANAVTKIFEHIKKAPREYKFTTPTDHMQMLFPTPVGKSYRCEQDIVIEMKDENLVAKLNLRQLKMQPFIFKKDEFGPEFVCSPGGAKSYRDETAPIAVGSTLAIVTLLTVTGYGVYRYMKVKKVQYDAME